MSIDYGIKMMLIPSSWVVPGQNKLQKHKYILDLSHNATRRLGYVIVMIAAQ